MIQKTNVAYLELLTHLKRETVKVIFQMIGVTYCLFLLMDATGFENGYPYNTSLCILHVAKTVTLTAVDHSFHTRVHMEWPGWVSSYAWCNIFDQKGCVCVQKARVQVSLLCVMHLWNVFGLSSIGAHKKQYAEVLSCEIVCKMLVAQLLAT